MCHGSEDGHHFKKQKLKIGQVEVVKMARDKWQIARWIAIAYLILGAITTVMLWIRFIEPGAGNLVADFLFYFFLPVWATISPFFPPL
jgi:hypothetical protein